MERSARQRALVTPSDAWPEEERKRMVSAILALLLCPGTGPVATYQALVAARRAGKDLHELFGLSKARLAHLLPAAPPPVYAALASCGRSAAGHAEKLLSACAAHGVRAFVRGEAGYPKLLGARLGPGAPLLLFMRGNSALAEPVGVGVVGTRAPSCAGLRWAAGCARTLALQGVAVISGGAAGVDLAAHTASLEAGGKTVAVLPEGLLAVRLTPILADAVAAGTALLLSEAPPEAGWETHRAVARNRLIAALSQALCVIEPRKRGGSLCTARWGLAQGIPVFIGGALASIMREYPEALPLSGTRGDGFKKQLVFALNRPARFAPLQTQFSNMGGEEWPDAQPPFIQ